MSRWFDPNKKKEEEQTAQSVEPEEPKEPEDPMTSSAAEIAKILIASNWKPLKSTTQTPSAPETNYIGAYGLKANSKGEATLDLTGKHADSLQNNRLVINNEVGFAAGQTKLATSLNKQIDSEQETRQKAAQAAQTRGAAMQSLSGMNLMGFDGQAIDINTADPATVVRGINSIADSDVRAQAAKLYKTLTQTEGSRFYGENTESVGTFLESANLTQSDYKEQVSDFNSLFYGDGQHGDEDAGAYLKALQKIESGDYSTYVKSQLTAALDKPHRRGYDSRAIHLPGGRNEEMRNCYGRSCS